MSFRRAEGGSLVDESQRSPPRPSEVRKDWRIAMRPWIELSLCLCIDGIYGISRSARWSRYGGTEGALRALWVGDN